MANTREVMGQQGLATMQRYLQFKPKQDAACRISVAFMDSAAPDPVGKPG